jgi:5-methylcytosine-specific restriction endonuclease McrA
LGVTKKLRFYYKDRDYYSNYYLKTEHWVELRKEKLKHNSKCENCGITKTLDVHHINYKNLYDVELADLKTLCRKCHVKEHAALKILFKKFNVEIQPDTIYLKQCEEEKIKIKNLG